MQRGKSLFGACSSENAPEGTRSRQGVEKSNSKSGLRERPASRKRSLRQPESADEVWPSVTTNHRRSMWPSTNSSLAPGTSESNVSKPTSVSAITAVIWSTDLPHPTKPHFNLQQVSCPLRCVIHLEGHCREFNCRRGLRTSRFCAKSAALTQEETKQLTCTKNPPLAECILANCEEVVLVPGETALQRCAGPDLLPVQSTAARALS